MKYGLAITQILRDNIWIQKLFRTSLGILLNFTCGTPNVIELPQSFSKSVIKATWEIKLFFVMSDRNICVFIHTFIHSSVCMHMYVRKPTDVPPKLLNKFWGHATHRRMNTDWPLTGHFRSRVELFKRQESGLCPWKTWKKDMEWIQIMLSENWLTLFKKYMVGTLMRNITSFCF